MNAAIERLQQKTEQAQQESKTYKTALDTIKNKNLETLLHEKDASINLLKKDAAAYRAALTILKGNQTRQAQLISQLAGQVKKGKEVNLCRRLLYNPFHDSVTVREDEYLGLQGWKAWKKAGHAGAFDYYTIFMKKSGVFFRFAYTDNIGKQSTVTVDQKMNLHLYQYIENINKTALIVRMSLREGADLNKDGFVDASERKEYTNYKKWWAQEVLLNLRRLTKKDISYRIDRNADTFVSIKELKACQTEITHLLNSAGKKYIIYRKQLREEEAKKNVINFGWEMSSLRTVHAFYDKAFLGNFGSTIFHRNFPKEKKGYNAYTVLFDRDRGLLYTFQLHDGTITKPVLGVGKQDNKTLDVFKAYLRRSRTVVKNILVVWFDGDQNGKISRDEAYQAVQRMDKNKDGKVDKQELASVSSF